MHWGTQSLAHSHALTELSTSAAQGRCCERPGSYEALQVIAIGCPNEPTAMDDRTTNSARQNVCWDLCHSAGLEGSPNLPCACLRA